MANYPTKEEAMADKTEILKAIWLTIILYHWKKTEERVTGIGPVSATWQAAVLPLNYTRNIYFYMQLPACISCAESTAGRYPRSITILTLNSVFAKALDRGCVGVPRLELGTSSSQTRRSTI